LIYIEEEIEAMEILLTFGLIVLGINWLFLPFMVAMIAKAKGYNSFLWWFNALFFGLVALFVMMGIPDKNMVKLSKIRLEQGEKILNELYWIKKFSEQSAENEKPHDEPAK
jgi:hypothetical protein